MSEDAKYGVTEALLFPLDCFSPRNYWLVTKGIVGEPLN